jgi:hypothetical protein
MRPVQTKDGIEPDKDLRAVEFMKSNYGPIAETVTVRWKAGVFVTEPKAGSLEKIAAEAEINHLFLKLLRRLTEQGRNVSDKASPSYAPSMFANEQDAKTAKVGKKEFSEAMSRLFAGRKIRIVPFGPPSKMRSKIVEVWADEGTAHNPFNDPSNDPSNGPFKDQEGSPDGLPGLPDARVRGMAPGQKCQLCGSGRDVFLIQHRKGEAADPVHKDCAARAWGQP